MATKAAANSAETPERGAAQHPDAHPDDGQAPVDHLQSTRIQTYTKEGVGDGAGKGQAAPKEPAEKAARSIDTAGGGASYLPPPVAESQKLYLDAVSADKTLQQVEMKLNVIAGEFDKLQKSKLPDTAMVDDKVHKPQTVAELRQTLQSEYAESSQNLPEQQKQVYEKWVQAVAAADKLPMSGPDSAGAGIDKFNRSLDGAQRRELLKSLGISASEVSLEELQKRSAKVSESLKNNDLPKAEKEALQGQADQLNKLIPLETTYASLELQRHAPVAVRYQMAQMLNSGELGDTIQKSYQALAAARLTTEVYTMDTTGSISTSPEFLKLMASTNKDLLTLTQLSGENPAMRTMLDSMQTAVSLQARDPRAAEAAFQSAMEASKKLDISAFASDLNNQRDPDKFVEMYAKMLAVETMKESYAKFSLDQGHVDRALGLLGEQQIKSGELLRTDYTNLNSDAPRENQAFSKLLNAALTRPDLPINPTTYLGFISHELQGGENIDVHKVFDNITQLKQEMARVDVKEVQETARQLTATLQQIRDNQTKLAADTSVSESDRAVMQKQLTEQSNATETLLKGEEKLLFQKAHTEYLEAFANMVKGDTSLANQQFLAFKDAHPEIAAKPDYQLDKLLEATRERSIWERNRGWIAPTIGVVVGGLVAGLVAWTIAGAPAAPEAGVAAGTAVTAAIAGTAATEATVGGGTALTLGVAATTEATIGGGTAATTILGSSLAGTLVGGGASYAFARQYEGDSWDLALRSASYGATGAMLGTSMLAPMRAFGALAPSANSSLAYRVGAFAARGSLTSGPLAALEATNDYRRGVPLLPGKAADGSSTPGLLFDTGLTVLWGGLGHGAEVPSYLKAIASVPRDMARPLPLILGGALAGNAWWQSHNAAEANMKDAVSNFMIVDPPYDK